ncbi:helix-turn-helix domain-containing protein [Bacillus sp. MMSF_3328]|uniref:helix-turn-helix domain-containing protein n=1 Tax=Bacillus sp. MMSF_3328 TaxID=3047080 RepID=UPI00273D11C8|nr:helix-turn-helix transcriptional regulator [Bacillus sp. MMSF_3328]
MNYRSILGKNIHKHRKIKGISQEKLAEDCSLHRTYIGAVERGERNISIDNIEKIAIALEIDIKQLFEDEKDDNNVC